MIPSTTTTSPVASTPPSVVVSPARQPSRKETTTSSFDQNPGLFYRHIWRSYLDTASSFSSHLDLLQAREANAIAHLDFSLPSILPEHAGLYSAAALITLAKKIVQALKWIAERRFSPKNTPPLAIDGQALIDEFVTQLIALESRGTPNHFPARRFDPVLIWEALMDRYQHRAAEHIYEQSARLLRDWFFLAPSSRVKQRGTRFALELPVTTVTRQAGVKVYDWDSIARLRTLADAFAGFLASLSPLHLSLSRFRTALEAPQFQLTSGDTYPVCDGVVLVTYQSKFVVLLRQEVAAELQEFVSRWAPPVADAP